MLKQVLEQRAVRARALSTRVSGLIGRAEIESGPFLVGGLDHRRSGHHCRRYGFQCCGVTIVPGEQLEALRTLVGKTFVNFPRGPYKIVAEDCGNFSSEQGTSSCGERRVLLASASHFTRARRLDFWHRDSRRSYRLSFHRGDKSTLVSCLSSSVEFEFGRTLVGSLGFHWDWGGTVAQQRSSLPRPTHLQRFPAANFVRVPNLGW